MPLPLLSADPVTLAEAGALGAHAEWLDLKILPRMNDAFISLE
jgi:hypothetical protein